MVRRVAYPARRGICGARGRGRDPAGPQRRRTNDHPACHHGSGRLPYRLGADQWSRGGGAGAASDCASGPGLLSGGEGDFRGAVDRGEPAAAAAPEGRRGDAAGRDLRYFPNLLERAASPGTRLSGGEQQMLAVARALRTGARLLLLDEISEGLAPVIVQKLGEVIRTLRQKGFTVVLVEQNFRFAAPLADRFYVMEHGKIVKQFARSELASQAGLLQEFLGV